MNLKLLTAAAAAALLAVGASSASAVTTIIGGTGQSNSQAVNSSQAGDNGTGGTSTFILGNSTPTETQTSNNSLTNTQALGGGTTTLIANGAGACFCQSSQQGVNSSQVGVNGDGGTGTTAITGNSSPSLTQGSTNSLTNMQSIGVVGASTTLIGSAAQANTQGENSTQAGKNGSAGGGLLFVNGVSNAALAQASNNVLINTVVLGG